MSRIIALGGLRSLVVLSAAAAAMACARSADDAIHPRGDAPPASTAQGAPLPEAVAQGATVALAAYLEASREGSATRAALDTLAACGDEGAAYFPTSLLAAWSLLPFEMRGDTVVARASVVTVAEQEVDRNRQGFIARLRVRSDVLEWDVYRVGDEQWVVCNGLRFGYAGADSLTTWRPEGASYETARQLADSIWRARGHP